MKMFCLQCQKEGLKSYVFEGVSNSTLVYYQPYYDENGNYHHNNNNKITTSYTCSNGHSWIDSPFKKD